MDVISSKVCTVWKRRPADVGLYVQDQFRATQRLSITMGLRWEYFQPERDPGGTISYFDPNRFDRARAATVLPNGEIVIGTENPGNGIVVAGQGCAGECLSEGSGPALQRQ